MLEVRDKRNYQIVRMTEGSSGRGMLHNEFFLVILLENPVNVGGKFGWMHKETSFEKSRCMVVK